MGSFSNSKKLKIVAGIALLMQLNPVAIIYHLGFIALILEDYKSLLPLAILFSLFLFLVPVISFIRNDLHHKTGLIYINIGIIIILIIGFLTPGIVL